MNKKREDYKKEVIKKLMPERVNKSGNFKGTHPNNKKASRQNVALAHVGRIISLIKQNKYDSCKGLIASVYKSGNIKAIEKLEGILIEYKIEAIK